MRIAKSCRSATEQKPQLSCPSTSPRNPHLRDRPSPRQLPSLLPGTQKMRRYPQPGFNKMSSSRWIHHESKHRAPHDDIPFPTPLPSHPAWNLALALALPMPRHRTASPAPHPIRQQGTFHAQPRAPRFRRTRIRPPITDATGTRQPPLVTAMPRPPLPARTHAQKGQRIARQSGDAGRWAGGGVPCVAFLAKSYASF